MKIKRLFCLIAAAAMYLLSAACGEPIEPTDSDPMFDAPQTEATTAYTGSMAIESAYTKRTSATTATTAFTTSHTRKEEIIVSFTKKEILEAANLPAMYQTYGYLDVDGLSVNYGEITVQRDNGIYTIPQGYDLHYITQIDVYPVTKGSTVVLTGTAFIKVLADVPAEEYSSAEDPDAPAEGSDSAEGTTPGTEETSAAAATTTANTAKPDKEPKTVKAVKLEKTAKFTIVKYTG
ncbi:MAG: hypothetical protein IJ060_03310 [Oscillospiraceae bacterium]|nr:hypothetical protein [Oscillospiraceae bacterium]